MAIVGEKELKLHLQSEYFCSASFTAIPQTNKWENYIPNKFLYNCIVEGNYSYIISDNVLIKYNLTTNTSEYYIYGNAITVVSLDNVWIVSFWGLTKEVFNTLTVCDILGRKVQTLVNGEKSAGNYKVEFNAENFPRGVYIYVLHAGNYINTIKLVPIK